MNLSANSLGRLRLLAVAAVAAALAWGAAHVSQAAAGNNRGTLAAYVWANDMSAKSYVPNDTYYFSAARQPANITHSSLGVYTVRFPGVAVPGGHAQVTSYGAGPTHCKIQSWNAQGTEQVVNVNCYGANGGPADTQFALAFFN